MKRTDNTKDLVLTGLMTALIYLAGSIIKIPSFGGFVHIGDCMVFLSVVVLGKKRGSAASAAGMFLVDALGGYYLWAPFTLIIKGGMAYIAGSLIEKINIKKLVFKYVIAFSAASIFMIIGYFLSGIIMAGLFTERAGLLQGIIYASKDIVGNIIQVVTGMVIAVPLTIMLKKTKRISFQN